MALATAARNAACDSIVDLFDAGAAQPKIQIFDSGSTTLVEWTFNATAAFGNAGASTAGEAIAATFTTTATASVSGGGSANAFGWRILDGDGTEIASRTNSDDKSISGGGDRDAIAGTGGNTADIALNQSGLSISDGQELSFTGNVIFRVPAL
ncbi:MAG: hypothetical protein AAGA75_23625 [Cyanobacteria bacterium P01_E01_bin.6]